MPPTWCNARKRNRGFIGALVQLFHCRRLRPVRQVRTVSNSCRAHEAAQAPIAQIPGAMDSGEIVNHDPAWSDGRHRPENANRGRRIGDHAQPEAGDRRRSPWIADIDHFQPPNRAIARDKFLKPLPDIPHSRASTGGSAPCRLRAASPLGVEQIASIASARLIRGGGTSIITASGSNRRRSARKAPCRQRPVRANSTFSLAMATTSLWNAPAASRPTGGRTARDRARPWRQRRRGWPVYAGAREGAACLP